MANALPPVKGSAYTFPIALVDQGDTDVFQTTVTITVADVWVSKDGGAFVAATAAPTELLTGGAAKTGVLWQGLTATEMDADIVTVLYHDADGSEWQDALVTIYTSAQTLDTIDTNVDSILTDTGTTLDTKIDTLDTNVDAILADTGTDGVLLYPGSIKTNSFFVGAITGDVISGSAASKIAAVVQGADLDTLKTLSDQLDVAQADLDSPNQYKADVSGLPSAAAVADAVWDEASADHVAAGTTGAALSAAGGSGAGAIEWTYTLTSSVDGSPIADADIWVSTDAAGSNIVASGRTDAFGVVTCYLDAGTYYVWRQKSGWDFTNPDTEVVS